MDIVADYLAKAQECEEMAAAAGVPHASAILLAIAANWREMAEDLADRDAARRAPLGPSLSA